MCLSNCQVLLVGVNDPHGRGNLGHVADTAERTLELFLLTAHHEEFLLGAARSCHIVEVNELQLLETGDTLGDCLEVGQHAAEPALVHVGHANALSLLLDGRLSLLLRANEKDVATMSNGLLDEVVGLVDVINGLLEIDDVDRVTIGEDVTLHLRVPAAGLMPEVDTSFKQLAHGNDCHGRPFSGARVRAVWFVHRAVARCPGAPPATSLTRPWRPSAPPKRSEKGTRSQPAHASCPSSLSEAGSPI